MYRSYNLAISLHFYNAIKLSCRRSSKIAVELNIELAKKLEDDEIKYRHHPGRCHTGNICLPEHIINALKKSIRDYPIKSLIHEGELLNRYIQSRHPPSEDEEVRTKLKEIKSEVKLKNPLPDISAMTEGDIEKHKNKQQMKVKKIMKERIFAWRPLSYGPFESLVYAIGRSAQEFTILSKIFIEINNRHSDYKPRSYFDFGSGVGTGMWAASKLWNDTIFEYFNVDSSRDMNELSDLILRDGNENQQSILKNVFYRQFLPANDTKYDLVVSSFSLFELPNNTTRKAILQNLWKKCDGYLVIVEEGTRAGFQLIAEARDYILNSEEISQAGHVFSPCPSNHQCPRLTNIFDKTPCNFEITYEALPIGRLKEWQSMRYCYVVLKKGPRDVYDKSNNWPRIVRPTLNRKKHSICRTCTSEGSLQEIIFTPSKHGKLAYRCARSSKWGDRLPISIITTAENTPKAKLNIPSIVETDLSKTKL